MKFLDSRLYWKDSVPYQSKKTDGDSRIKRILFLVDRTALGIQIKDAFKDSRMESLQTFADIFEIKGLKEAEAERR